jgi:transcriptional regulator with XRE-family HTH domain
MSTTLGERLRILRKARGLSQEAVARRAEIGLRAYGDLERGRASDPHYSTLEGIAYALNTTVAELVSEEPEPVLAGPKAEAPQETGQLDLEKATALREWLSNVRKTAQPIMEQDDQTIAAYRQALARMKGGIGVSDAYFVEEESPEQAKLEAEALDFLLAKEEQRRREMARNR